MLGLCPDQWLVDLSNYLHDEWADLWLVIQHWDVNDGVLVSLALDSLMSVWSEHYRQTECEHSRGTGDTLSYSLLIMVTIYYAQSSHDHRHPATPSQGNHQWYHLWVMELQNQDYVSTYIWVEYKGTNTIQWQCSICHVIHCLLILLKIR